jgi:hypothetical protein
VTEPAIALAAVVAHDLGGTVRLPAPDGPLDDQAFDELVQGAAGARALGLLARAVAEGWVEVDDAKRDRCLEAAAGALVHDLRRERLLVDEIASLLEDAAAPFLVLKGAAAAHLDELDPALRSSSDIDLLVRGEDFDRTVEALAAEGWRRRFPEPRPGFDARFGKGAAVHRDGEEIDLHRTLAPGVFGLRLPVADLWVEPEPFVLGGRTLHALAPVNRLLHGCYHASLGAPTPRLTALRDVVHLARRLEPDHPRFAESMVRWGGSAVVERTARLVDDTFGLRLPILDAAVEEHPPPTRDRRALDPYRRTQGRYGRQALAAARAVPGWRNRLDYLLALAWPTADYVHGRHRSTVSRWRSVLGRRR